MKTLLVINSGGAYEDSTNSNLVISTELEFSDTKALVMDFVELLGVALEQYNKNCFYGAEILNIESYFNYLFETTSFNEWELFYSNGYSLGVDFVPDRIIKVDGLIWYFDENDYEVLDIVEITK